MKHLSLLLALLVLLLATAARAQAPSPAAATTEEVVAEELVAPPQTKRISVYDGPGVTISKYTSWADAYEDGTLKMVPPGREFVLQDTIPTLSPTPEPPKAASPSPAPEPAKAPLPKRDKVTVTTFNSWQAAYLEGYGFPAAGQKVPKKPVAVNATDATATAANATTNATATANATTTAAKKTGSRRMMMLLPGVLREPLE